jgi:CMP-N-acetylneuraminic acid synthetase
MRIVALIPARSGSKRIAGKNTKVLGGKPLIRWTVDAAIYSGVFDSVNVCTDDIEAAHAAGVPVIWRSPVSDAQPDIEWVLEALTHFPDVDAFAILRPTSPFRTPEYLRAAWNHFRDFGRADSLRAVREVKEHPGKMWTRPGHRYDRDGDTTVARFVRGITPLLPYHHEDGTPWHSSPTQTLPLVYVQTASLEIAWTKTVELTGTIAGSFVLPFDYADKWCSFDINTQEDWDRAERYVAALQAPAPAQ